MKSLPGVVWTMGFAATILVGCGVSVGPLRSGDQERIAAKRGSIVVLRLLATADGAPVELLPHLPGSAILVADNIDTGDQVRDVRSPTDQSRQEGWIYLVLEPGRYQMRVRLAGGRISWRWFVRVPTPGTVLYVGTLPVSCLPKSRDSAAPHFLGRCWSIDGPVSDESERAAEISQLSFAQYGPPVTVLMQRPPPEPPAATRDERPVHEPAAEPQPPSPCGPPCGLAPRPAVPPEPQKGEPPS